MLDHTRIPGPEPETARFEASALLDFALRLLAAAGLPRTMATDVAQVLLEGDLLGHDTHGLALLAGYLKALETGSMTREGRHTVLSRRATVATWDGRRLPGPWLVRRALEWVSTRARRHGCATVVIRRSHHIACLAAYLEPLAREGLLVTIASADPAAASVAPFGGTRAVFTPNPIAVGIPTAEDPVILDISSSVTTNGMSARLREAGEHGPHAWWLDAQGRPSRDPAVLFDTPAGTILPLGGLEAGHKGYALALMIEALTGALAGHGRADPAEGWGASVFVQAFDPEAFAGRNAFTRQTDWIVRACRDNAPRPGPGGRVRLPGERALALKEAQLRAGVRLHPLILPALAGYADQAGIALPTPKPRSHAP